MVHFFIVFGMTKQILANATQVTVMCVTLAEKAE